MIGPPGSGKSRIAKILAPLLEAEIISTDEIRKKLYGNESIQGNWSEIKNVIDNKILFSFWLIGVDICFISEPLNNKNEFGLHFIIFFLPLESK